MLRANREEQKEGSGLNTLTSRQHCIHAKLMVPLRPGQDSFSAVAFPHLSFTNKKLDWNERLASMRSARHHFTFFQSHMVMFLVCVCVYFRPEHSRTFPSSNPGLTFFLYSHTHKHAPPFSVSNERIPNIFQIVKQLNHTRTLLSRQSSLVYTLSSLSHSVSSCIAYTSSFSCSRSL